MPSFKPKPPKTIKYKESISTITLDSKHNEYLSRFENIEEKEVPKLLKEIEHLNEKKKKTKNIEDFLDLKDKVKELKVKIKKLKLEQQNYYLNNSKYIFDYFENKQSISSGSTQTSNILESFFNIQPTKKKKGSESLSNIQNYFKNLDENYLDLSNYVVPVDICEKCKSGELIPIADEGLMVCNNCSLSIKYVIDNEKPSYKEPPKEVCFYAYKRINHFREILAQFQAKESTQIPDDVIENIKSQIKKERINVSSVTNKKCKEILKKLGYNKYYEHIPFIKDKLGIRPPIMSQDLEETLCNLFMEIQAPYSKYCPDDRVNFLNYYYTIYKLCELLDQRQFLPFFPMLKDREKRIEQDEIWKKICEELEWDFIPTI